jgi:ribokinase
MRAARVAVVGHVEWVDLVRVGRIPAPGEVVEATSTTELAAGSGGIAALQLAKLAGAVTFFTRLTDDERGHRAREELERQGVRVEALDVTGEQRRAFVLVDDTSERTIVVTGEKRVPLGSDPLPWRELEDHDGVLFLCGDAGALEAARGAPVLAASARWLPGLQSAGVRLDALVRSDVDPSERYATGDLSPEPALVVSTEGALGGSLSVSGGPAVRFDVAHTPGAAVDAYGCGDSFAAGLLFALVEGAHPEDAVAFAARCGAACLAGEALSGQLRLSDAESSRAPSITP